MKEFKSIAPRYKAVFFDAFGVLKNYDGLIPGISNTLSFLEDNGIDYYVLTNDASRSPDELAESYQKLGVTAVTTEKILSSGMLAKEYLEQKIRKGIVTYLGTPQSGKFISSGGSIQALPIGELDLEIADEIKAVVFLDDEGFDWNHDINTVVNLLRMRNIPVIVANTDVAYPVSREKIAIAIGGIADMVEEVVGKTFLRFGKPDAQMFIFAYEYLLQKHENISRSEILMVGDTLTTDIIGGNKFGLDTALVLTGNTLPHKAKLKIESSGIIPTHVCHSAGM